MSLPNYKYIRYFVQDESRFGLKTIAGRRTTLKGVKPIGKLQWQFQAFWLYGAVEPLTGDSFFWQFSHVDTECYQQFLNELAACHPDTINIIQVDNGFFIKLKSYKFPKISSCQFNPLIPKRRFGAASNLMNNSSEKCLGKIPHIRSRLNLIQLNEFGNTSNKS